MIVEWFLDVWAGFVEWIMTLFGEITLPEWFTGGMEVVLTIVNNGAGLGAWVPWAIVGGAVAFSFSIWIIGFVVKFARWLLGLVPTMGGS